MKIAGRNHLKRSHLNDQREIYDPTRDILTTMVFLVIVATVGSHWKFWWPFIIGQLGLIGGLIATGGLVYLDWAETKSEGKKGEWRRALMALLIVSLLVGLYQAAETDRKAAQAITNAAKANERAANVEGEAAKLNERAATFEKEAAILRGKAAMDESNLLNLRKQLDDQNPLNLPLGSLSITVKYHTPLMGSFSPTMELEVENDTTRHTKFTWGKKPAINRIGYRVFVYEFEVDREDLRRKIADDPALARVSAEEFLKHIMLTVRFDTASVIGEAISAEAEVKANGVPITIWISGPSKDGVVTLTNYGGRRI